MVEMHRLYLEFGSSFTLSNERQIAKSLIEGGLVPSRLVTSDRMAEKLPLLLFAGQEECHERRLSEDRRYCWFAT